MKKFLKISLISLFGLYLIYFIVIAVVLNTPLLSKITEMGDEDLTHLRFQGAFSFFPGKLWIYKAKIAVRDQNVSLDVFIFNTKVDFNLLPLLKKTLHTTRVEIQEAKLNIGMKSPEEKTKFIARYTTEKNANLPLRIAIANKNRETHLKFEFPKIHITQISEIKNVWGDFKGDVNLDGGFRIQPGVEVEVFPTTLRIQNGNLKDQFENVDLLAKVQFLPFFIPDAPGNAVFPYVNADISLQAQANAMPALDLTLQSLPHYRFIGEKSNVRSHLMIEKGKLMSGSFLDTDPTFIGLETPDLKAQGKGDVKWKMSEHHSELDVNLQEAKMQKTGSNLNQGKVKKASLHLNLYGNELVHLFHGLVADLRFEGLQWTIQNTDSVMKGDLSGEGKILGIAGNVEDSVRKRWAQKRTSFQLILHSKIKPTQFPSVSMNGTLTAIAEPIDFTSNSIRFDQVKSGVMIEVNRQGKTQASLKMKDLSYQLAPIQTWKGHLDLLIDDTAPFIHALRDQKKINALVSLFGNVSQLQADIDLEAGKDFSWFKVNSVRSSGIWSAYGTLMQNHATESDLSGLFEVKVAGLPIGIRIQSSRTDVTFLPSEDWYNAVSESQLH